MLETVIYIGGSLLHQPVFQEGCLYISHRLFSKESLLNSSGLSRFQRLCYLSLCCFMDISYSKTILSSHSNLSHLKKQKEFFFLLTYQLSLNFFPWEIRNLFPKFIKSITFKWCCLLLSKALSFLLLTINKYAYTKKRVVLWYCFITCPCLRIWV